MSEQGRRGDRDEVVNRRGLRIIFQVMLQGLSVGL
jgi:hypothetical protein